MTGLHIASRLDPRRFDVSLVHEDWHGPYDVTTSPRADIVFLTGLQHEFDRMRQLSCLFRRRATLTVGGGTICSLFPDFASEFFDVVCAGGVDAVIDVADDFLNNRVRRIYRSPYLVPRPVRLDHGHLARAGINPPVHFIEGSRGCSFKCSFCTIPVEGDGHRPYGVEAVRTAIDDSIAASPRWSLRRLYPYVLFLDNNFSDDRGYLEDMMAMLSGHPKLRGWTAMITQNVLGDKTLITRMAASKCRQVFVGLESFDPDALRRYNKKQNLGSRNVLDDIAHAEGQGISVAYGYLFDPRHQTAACMEASLRHIAQNRQLPMPLFLSLMSPLAGTAVFWSDVAQNKLAPRLRLRDLDGESVAYRVLADTPAAYAVTLDRILRRPWRITGIRQVVIKAIVRMVRARTINPLRLWIVAATNLHGISWARALRSRRLSYMTDDVLDPQYDDMPSDLTPADRVRYFEPIFVTDDEAVLMPWLARYRPDTTPSRQESDFDAEL